ncbi:MAG: diguanylate cyclase [Deltaproteobacteria bacterium]|nr:diguanylate cyclase [Candidatus Zymogenaceae bacterium]
MRTDTQTTVGKRIISLGILLALSYWLLESFIEAYLFHSNSFVYEVLSPRTNELWMRIAVIVLILAFSVYAHIMVTRHRKLEELCRVTEQTQQSLLNATTEGAILLSLDGTISAINDRAAEDFGAQGTGIIGKNIYDLMPPDVASRRRAHHKMVIETKWPLRFEDEREDGRWFDINIYPVIDDAGQVVQVAIFGREITASKKMERELTRLSITDDLTGLLNQRHFMEKIEQEVERAKRMGYPLCLVILDVDDFKVYNDTYGHLKGNEILKGIGEIVRHSVRKDVDSAYRFGGDEFALILPYAERDRALEIIDRIGARTTSELDGVTISAGVALLTDGVTVHDLIHSADKSMYKQKGQAMKPRTPHNRRSGR